MQRKTKVLIGVLVVWLACLFVLIESRGRSARYIIPVAAVAFVVYLAYSSVVVTKAAGNEESNGKEKSRQSNKKK